MSIISTALIKPLAIAVGVLALSNVVTFGLWRIAAAERDGADTELQVADDANTGNMATITALRAAVDQCVGQEQHLADMAEQAAIDLAAAEIARAEATRLAKQNRDRIYANDPNCRAWATGPVCVAVSDSL
ncbi:MAG: hypothetical protein KBF48_13755 [Xanthomonadales bacterium]|nr:hypothetical protein [Xanthomonadales bacterium]